MECLQERVGKFSARSDLAELLYDWFDLDELDLDLGDNSIVSSGQSKGLTRSLLTSALTRGWSELGS